MQKDTIFSLMSMTKPIVSTALMMLFEEGRFMLDDPIANWLPSYANKQVLDPVSGGRVPTVRPVTIRHVLTHTSGLSLAPPNGGGPQADGDAATVEGAALVAAQLAQQTGQAATAAVGRERPKTARRSDRARRKLSAGLSTRRALAVRLVNGLCRRARREDVRHDDRSVPARADLPAARHDRHALQHPAREG